MMKTRARFRLVIFAGIVLALFLLSASARPQAIFDEEEGMVSMDFENVDIRVVVKYISDLTGKNFIIDQNVRGPVTVISPTKIPLEEVYKVFESILEVRGFVTVPSGKVIKIASKTDARQRNIPMAVGDRLEQIVPEDTIITQLVPLQYASAERIRTALGQLFSKDASVIAYPTTNTLIVTDVSSNIHRLVKIVRELDIPGYETKITVISIRYASADLLAASLSEVIEEAGEVPGAPPTPRRRQPPGQLEAMDQTLKIIADERTNSLIILANDEDTRRVQELIKRLDVETERSRIHVYFLRNTSAEEMAKVLNTIVSKRKPRGNEDPVLISEDKGTNSLIIDSPQEFYADIVKIIQKLDVVRDQVLVEVLIAEISYEKTFELGVEWLDMDNNGKGFPDIETMEDGAVETFGQSAYGVGLGSWVDSAMSTGEDSSTRSSPGVSGLSFGFIQKMAGTGTSLPDFAVMLHALQTNQDVNILATPQVLTMDNEEAKIKVVRNIPYLSKIEDSSDTDRTFQNIEYKDVGIELTITPNITKGEMVRMQIHQKISTLISSGEASGIRLTPETFDRETETMVTVKDNHTIVIGGLIRDDWNESINKIPILGDIPLLGNLFRTRATRKTKNNLLIFITPRVVRTTQQIADLTSLKRRHAPEIDEIIKAQEAELAAKGQQKREEEEQSYRDLKARHADQLQRMRQGENALIPPPEPAPAAAAPEPEAAVLEVGEEDVKEPGEPRAPRRSLLDSIPKVSFGREKEAEDPDRGTRRFHR
jgi:general secretion pathway protein D